MHELYCSYIYDCRPAVSAVIGYTCVPTYDILAKGCVHCLIVVSIIRRRNARRKLNSRGQAVPRATTDGYDTTDHKTSHPPPSRQVNKETTNLLTHFIT